MPCGSPQKRRTDFQKRVFTWSCSFLTACSTFRTMLNVWKSTTKNHRIRLELPEMRKFDQIDLRFAPFFPRNYSGWILWFSCWIQFHVQCLILAGDDDHASAPGGQIKLIDCMLPAICLRILLSLFDDCAGRCRLVTSQRIKNIRDMFRTSSPLGEYLT